MALLYLSDDLDGISPGDRVRLGGDEARHAAVVARVRPGEPITVGDGRGLLVHGVVVAAEPDLVVLGADEVVRVPARQPEIWLAQALAKGDRDELAVQASTELGVDGVIPWSAERSVSRWQGTKADRGRDRWRAIVREATKQSVRARIPEVSPLATTAELARLPDCILVLDPTAERALTELEPVAGRLTIVVGPEGGISPRELDVFDAAGAIRVRLGPEILRTSTAGPAALAVLNARLGRW